MRGRAFCTSKYTRSGLCSLSVLKVNSPETSTAIRVTSASDQVRTAVTESGLEYESAEAAFLPTVEIELDEDQAKRVFRVIDALEDSDDVQDVYANYSVSDDVMAKLG